MKRAALAIGATMLLAASAARGELIHYDAQFSAANTLPPSSSTLAGHVSLTWDSDTLRIVELLATVGPFPAATIFSQPMRLGSIFGPTLDYIFAPLIHRPSASAGDGYYFDGATFSLLLTDVALSAAPPNSFASRGIAENNLSNGMARLIYVDQLTGQEALAANLVVPEPETYALLLAGLGLLGFAARRRYAAAEKGSDPFFNR